MRAEPRPRAAIPLRLLLTAALLLALVALLSTLLAVTDTALSVWQRLADAPRLVAWTLGVGCAALLGAAAWLLLGIWRGPPRPRAAPRDVPDRAALERRAAALAARLPDQSALAELAELDRRAASAQVFVALAGEVSAGKSSLMRALGAGADAAIDVRGGTTREVAHATARLPDGRALVLADLPGLNEAGDTERAALARAEATRAHAVVYVCDGDLSRSQEAELARLSALGKPLLIALNKTDRYRADELNALLAALKRRHGARALVVPIVAGGTEVLLQRAADGSERTIERQRPARLAALLDGLAALTAPGHAALEPGRQAAVLSELDARLARDEARLRDADATACVTRYTRRAVVGALAAVAPGTDLVIQGALATAMLRELTALHGLGLRDLDLDAFLARAGGTVRTTTSITLALAGNALKAFPGLGTLSGGLLHALAYGLVFDALGRAVAATLAERARFDAETALARFDAGLRAPEPARLVALARDAVTLLGRPRDAGGGGSR